MRNQSNIPSLIAAGCFLAILVADLIYGVVNGREPLLTWTEALFGAFALFSLFNQRIIEIAYSPSGGLKITQQVVETAVLQGAAAVVDKISAKTDETEKTDKATAETLRQIVASVTGAVQTELRQITSSIADAAEKGGIARLSGKRVLWVDDEPANNEYGIKSLQAQGVEVITSKTTREALEEVRKHSFAVIITDQLRDENGIRNERAGYELLHLLRENGINTPVILSTAWPDHEEVRRLGFYGAANTQHGIFELVLEAIQDQSKM